MTASQDLWSSFARDPRRRDHADLRASDEDRELILGTLAAAYADGRLERQEHEERSTAATTARTLGDLPPLVADLVPLRTPLARPARSPDSLIGVPQQVLVARAEADWRRRRRDAAAVFLLASLVTWLIWFATGADGFVWPAIVSAVTLINAAGVAFTREDIVARQVRRLERRQVRQQRLERLVELRERPLRELPGMRDLPWLPGPPDLSGLRHLRDLPARWRR